MKEIKRGERIYTKPVSPLTGTWAGSGLFGIRLIIVHFKLELSFTFKTSIFAFHHNFLNPSFLPF